MAAAFMSRRSRTVPGCRVQGVVGRGTDTMLCPVQCALEAKQRSGKPDQEDEEPLLDEQAEEGHSQQH